MTMNEIEVQKLLVKEAFNKSKAIPDFGGIGSINKALESNAYDQSACLHVVTSRIDEGRVLDKENYTLDPSGSYCSNEAIAYKAAETLLIRSLKENYDVKKDT